MNYPHAIRINQFKNDMFRLASRLVKGIPQITGSHMVNCNKIFKFPPQLDQFSQIN